MIYWEISSMVNLDTIFTLICQIWRSSTLLRHKESPVTCWKGFVLLLVTITILFLVMTRYVVTILYFSCYYSDVRSQLRGSQRSSISLIQPAAVTWTWPQWQNLKMGQSLASLGEHLRSVVSNQVCNRKYSITRIALHLKTCLIIPLI